MTDQTPSQSTFETATTTTTTAETRVPKGQSSEPHPPAVTAPAVVDESTDGLLPTWANGEPPDNQAAQDRRVHPAGDGEDLDAHANIHYPAFLNRWERRLRLQPPTVRPPPQIRVPLLPRASDAMTSLLGRVPPRRRFLLRYAYVVLWVTLGALLILFNNYKANTAEGGPSYLGCTDQLWAWAPEQCGLNGIYCTPFNNATTIVRCPTECLATRNQNKRWLGFTQQGLLASWVVGGNGIYRADSWVCPAAVHAGVVSQHWGGCAAVDYIGDADFFPSTSANGVTSLGFDSRFPKAFKFRSLPSWHCTDFSWAVTPVAIIAISLFPLLWPSKGGFFFALISSGFWYAVFFAIPVHGDGWTSQAFANYFITLAFSYYLYKLFIAPVMLSPARFPVDTFILTIAPFWFALHTEIMSAPVSNFGLTSRAFRDPTTLVIFCVGVPIVLLVCGLQLWMFRRHGMLVKYLACYGVGFLVYFLLPMALGLSLHLHHYTVGIILLPLTRLQMRTSLLAQGFLIGLVVQGISRWGAASPFDTSFQNNFGDENLSIPRPNFAVDPASLAANGTIRWEYGAINPSEPVPSGLAFDGFSLIINDVEVYRGAYANYSWPGFLSETTKDRNYYARVSLTAQGSVLEYSFPVMLTAGGTVTYQNGTVAYANGTLMAKEFGSAPQKSAADIAAELRELREAREKERVERPPPPIAANLAVGEKESAVVEPTTTGLSWIKDLTLFLLLGGVLCTDFASIEMKAVLVLGAGLYAAVHYRPASKAYILSDGSIERSEQTPPSNKKPISRRTITLSDIRD
ncbi:hypothetical protein HDU88_001201 [Geranomyces variabilis]|nr:hypothetical protein HDU88_001201 [Geranomyces variabilis]